MVINGINYYVGLYTMGADGFPEYEAHFEDFHALNDFIRENVGNPKYTNNQMCYSFIENIDGEPDVFSWVSNIEWQVFSEEQMQHEVDEFIEMMAEQKEEDARVDEFSKEIHYHEDGADYQKKQRHFNDIEYVCPHCLRTVDDLENHLVVARKQLEVTRSQKSQVSLCLENLCTTRPRIAMA